MTEIARSPLLIAEDPSELAHLGASLLISSARETMTNAPTFDLVLSGGSTPKDLYRKLVTEHRNSIPWERVRFFWGDERYVPATDPESNYRMAFELLLQPLGIQEGQIFRIRTELPSAAEAAMDYEKRLRSLFQTPAFDLSLLGLGEDGHTASLFPDAWDEWAELNKAGRWVAAPWVPHLRAHRITLLPHVLNSSAKIIYVVAGHAKAEILKNVLDYDASGAALYPAQLIHPRITSPSGHRRPIWLADRAAASSVRQAA